MNGWQCPVLWKSSSAFSVLSRDNMCKATPATLRRYVHPSLAHPQRALRLLRQTKLKQLFFVGDSTTRNHMASLLCRLSFDLHRMEQGHGEHNATPATAIPDRDGQLLGPFVPAWHDRVTYVRPGHGAGRFCTPTCVKLRRIDMSACILCWVPATMLRYGGCSFGLARQIKALTTGPQPVAPPGTTAFIVNDGLHAGAGEHASDTPVRRLQTFIDELRSSQSNLASASPNNAGTSHDGSLAHVLRSGNRILWRETSPQHFPESQDGAYPRPSAIQPVSEYERLQRLSTKSCAPISQPRRSAPLSMLDELESLGIQTIRVWNMSVSQWDAHPSAFDCTHFCEPSGVMEAWNAATLQALSSAKPQSLRGPGQAAPGRSMLQVFSK